MPHSYSAGEIAERGERLYQQVLRSQVESGNQGKFLVVDIETGEYAIAGDDLTATREVLERRPHAVLYGLRIGYQAAYHIRVC